LDGLFDTDIELSEICLSVIKLTAVHCCLQLPSKLWQDEKVNTETSAASASEQIFTGVSPWSSRPDMLWASARANGPYQRHPGFTVIYVDILCFI